MPQDIACAAATSMIVCTNCLAFQQSGLLCLGVAMVQLFKLQTCNKAMTADKLSLQLDTCITAC